MNSPSSDILPSLNIREEKSVLWVDTYYYKLSDHKITNMHCNIVWNSPNIKPKYFDILLQFQFGPTDEKECKLTCIRTPADMPRITYKLEFHCSINNFDQDPDVLVLLSDRRRVSQIYDLESVCISPKGDKIPFELKVVVKMIEYNCDSNAAHSMSDEEIARKTHQEEEFRKMKEKFNDEQILNDLYFILDIGDVKDIFTGRQTNEFAELKSTYIARTAAFARKIADHMTRINISSTELGIILNYILNGEQKQIDDKDLFEVYFEAHRMGLNFLIDLSREAILNRISNQTFMIEALNVTDHVGDEILFGEIANKYHSCDKTEQFSLEFLEKVKGFGIQGRFMLRSLTRHKRRSESVSHVETGESSQSSTQNDLFTSAVTLNV